MNWHERYAHQAGWTRELRQYIFARCRWADSRRVLEAGCGTGAVLQDLPSAGPEVHGLDISRANLEECSEHAPFARLTCGDALRLPYASGVFDITFCHFLLLWIPNPAQALLEMKRVTAPSGYVIAFAEPDYGARSDHPAELEWLGKQQNEALEQQGAALRRGLELANLFQLAGIAITETGTIRPGNRQSLTEEEWKSEWQVLRADLEESAGPQDLSRMQEIDRRARLLGEHMLNVPTYFAWGQV